MSQQLKLKDHINIYSKSAHRTLIIAKETDEIELFPSGNLDSIILLDENMKQVAYNIVNSTENKSTLRIKNPSSSFIIVSYLFNNISWTPKLDIIINKIKAECNLYFSGIVINQTGETFNTTMELISGNIRQSFPRLRASPIFKSFSAPLEATEVDDAVSYDNLPEDYKHYTLGKVKLYHRNAFPIWSIENIKINKTYTHDIDSKTEVNMGYNFIAPEFIPVSKAHLYTSDNKLGSFIGQTFVKKESQKGNKIELELGVSSVLSCTSTIQEIPIKNISNNGVITLVEKGIIINTNIINRSSEKAVLIIKKFFNTQNPITFSEKPNDIDEDKFVKWYIDINPIIEENKENLTFNCICVWRESIVNKTS